MNWPQIKKIIILKCHLLLFCVATMNHSGLDCDVWQKVDFIRQPATTNSVVEPRSSKALPKAKHAPKRVMVTVWWSAASLTHFSFLNPSETVTSEKYAQQISEMNWKLQTLQPAWVSRKWLSSSAWQHPTACRASASNVEWIRLQSFASSAIFTWPLTNWLPLIQTSWQHFAWKMLSKSFLNPEASIFMLQE